MLVQLTQRDSRTLEAARKRVPKRVEVAKTKLIYYNICFAYVLGGKKYNTAFGVCLLHVCMHAQLMIR